MSRAALEEAAHKYFIREVENGDSSYLGESDLVKFAEQESSSLKLLLSAICKGVAGIEWTESAYVEPGQVGIVVQHVHFPVELDSSGIPVLTEEILEALEATK